MKHLGLFGYLWGENTLSLGCGFFCSFVAEKMFYKNCNFFESIPY